MCFGYTDVLQNVIVNPITAAAYSFLKPFLNIKVENPLEKLPVLSMQASQFWVRLQLQGDQVSRIDFSIDFADLPEKAVTFHENFLKSHNHRVFVRHIAANTLHSDIVTFQHLNKSYTQSARTTQSLIGRAKGEIQTTLLGEGLHRNLMKSLYFSNEMWTNKQKDEICYVLLMDSVSEDTYIDLDEVRQIKDFEFYSFDVLDIEKPATNSIQHIVFFKFPLDSEKPNYHIRYPFHFRYQMPGGAEYTISKLFAQTQVYSSCSPKSEQLWDDELELGSFDSYLVNKLFGAGYEKINVVNVVTDKAGQISEGEVMYTEIPIGKKPHQTLIMLSTISITILSMLMIMNVIRKSKNFGYKKD